MHPIRLAKARTHNLKDVSASFRPGELVCLTGVSGAGKSSLALDTLYAEGQRRFVESFSPYARQFLERLDRPPMESLDPVAAGIAVDRRGPVRSSRSTVATLADVEPYLSALFAREAKPHCARCGVDAEWTDARAMAERCLEGQPLGQVWLLSYPKRVAGTEEFLDLRRAWLASGHRRLVVDGQVRELESLTPREVVGADGVAHVLVDRLKPSSLEQGRQRLSEALESAWAQGEGVATLHGPSGALSLRRGLACPRCAAAFEPPPPRLFSYQSPLGACPACRGFGRTLGIDWDKVVPDPRKSLAEGAIRAWNGKTTSWERGALKRFAQEKGIPYEAPWESLSAAQREAVFEGEGGYRGKRYPGVRAWFRWLEGRTYKMHVRVLLSRYRAALPCETCGGKRLNPKALAHRVDGLDLAAWHALELGDAAARVTALRARSGQGELARRELEARLSYLCQVGLGYLTLDRPARTLSGGEAQRVSLTAALGSSLTGALFVLDEPTVGLHPGDVPPLLEAMRALAARGNCVLVVEHEPAVVRAADRVLELGPAAGAEGGALCFDGPPARLARRDDLPTGRALAAPLRLNASPRPPTGLLRVQGARANNLAGLSVDVPLGVVCAVCGPSGSGKSTLAEEVVYRTVARALGVKDVEPPGACDGLLGLERVREVVLVDPSPLGRTSRGNPATYTKAWDRLRARFAAEPDAVMRGLSAAHFSFNVDGGRCEACAGEGAETVEMQFLADVTLPCPSCQGRRFKEEVLEVRLRGLSVSEVLALPVQAVRERFADDAALHRALTPLCELGLGYLSLGQPLSTLSGGEAQRLKLARALCGDPEGTLFVLDEPSAGLHPADVDKVVVALRGLAERGGSVLVVDHDVGLLAAADWLLDLGPGGGARGGRLLTYGTPAAVSRHATSATALALRTALEGAGEAPAKRQTSKADAPAALNAIEVRRAREHTLKELSCQIPHGKLVAVTGPSGSGKSSLVFDVVYAEGQRRFLETLSPYARQFLPTLPRPDVDAVLGIPPTVALAQRTARAGALSTVASLTEVGHYLRLLYAKLGTVHCPRDDAPIAPVSPDALFAKLRALGGTGQVLAPAVRARKGTYLDLFTAAAKAGVTRAWVDGRLVEVEPPPKLAKSREHDISLVVFDGSLGELHREAFERARVWAEGQVEVRIGSALSLYSSARSCPRCGFAAPELDPRFFSATTAQGRCPGCDGTGALVDEAGVEEVCVECGGARLAPLPRAVRLGGMRLPELLRLGVGEARAFVEALSFSGAAAAVGEPSRQELLRRLSFLEQVGLGYLALDRWASTLSGGELQRVRLSAQLGAGLTGALYVLDEPTIGLHPRDTARLIGNLRQLVDTGSTVVVVEHDLETLAAADHVLDLGPSGGRGGGALVAEGTPAQVLASPASPTARALQAHGRTSPRALPAPQQWLHLKGASAHNLRKVNLRLPLGRMTVVAGVSGSGKSTLVQKVLYPALCERLDRVAPKALAYRALEGAEALGRVLAVDQSPIGRTPRSVPATFLGIWDELRRVYAATPEARARGFSPTRFSFNSTSGGRCQTCEGQGVISHEMSFLPDVVTPCEGCGGARFDGPTLDVRYRGFSAGEALRLSTEEAREVFSALPKVKAPLDALCELGVGYLQLGQGSHTLSGGEAQRLKLAAELSHASRALPTLYVLDEPTTGLHVGDVARLIAFLHRLVDRGDTLVVIEHHPDVMAAADHLVELGPEGGTQGGALIAEGPPCEVAGQETPTGRVLRGRFEGSGAQRATA